MRGSYAIQLRDERLRLAFRVKIRYSWTLPAHYIDVKKDLHHYGQRFLFCLVILAIPAVCLCPLKITSFLALQYMDLTNRRYMFKGLCRNFHRKIFNISVTYRYSLWSLYSLTTGQNQFPVIV